VEQLPTLISPLDVKYHQQLQHAKTSNPLSPEETSEHQMTQENYVKMRLADLFGK
jgi:hypothetical protein